MSNDRAVYFFGDGRADGDGKMKELLGGKGAGLAEMTTLGLPVPPGFTITTTECIRFYNEGRRLRPGLQTRRAPRSSRWNRSWGAASAIRRARFWSRCARARACRCRA